ncbi:SLOG family protein [Bosea sp. TAF32]|uniref:SLOG family protein n=1 Tax=Bosea sp. TAF32 TaxID=3237482 RepID=UPI003F90B480
MTTIIVCGGRSYGLVPPGVAVETYTTWEEQAERERGRLDQILDAAVGRLALKFLACGDATGADALAAAWAERHGVPFKVYPADWQAHGKNAGPLRNRQMLEQELPSAVIAFPGSKGTRNMCDIAERAGVRVIKVDW